MSVTVRPFRSGGWEVDIHFRLPDGKLYRKRHKAPVKSKSGAIRWGEDRVRHLLRHGLPKPLREVATLEQFASRFVEEHAVANQQKPSGIAAKKTVLDTHLGPVFGTKRLDEITTEDVQRLKHKLQDRAPKTVNNVLTVLNTLLKKAVEWDEIERMPCSIRLLKTTKPKPAFYDFEEYERLVSAARHDGSQAYLIALLGGEAGLRCGEIMALEWSDVDLTNGQLCVARSEWKGHVTVPKGGHLRRVPLSDRLADALRKSRHLKSRRVVCDHQGQPMTQKMVQVTMRRVAGPANVKPGVHVLRHTFCSHLAMRGCPAVTIQALAGHTDLATTQRYMHLTPSALEAGIRLLNNRPTYTGSGDTVETEQTGT